MLAEVESGPRMRSWQVSRVVSSTGYADSNVFTELPGTAKEESIKSQRELAEYEGEDRRGTGQGPGKDHQQVHGGYCVRGRGREGPWLVRTESGYGGIRKVFNSIRKVKSEHRNAGR